MRGNRGENVGNVQEMSDKCRTNLESGGARKNRCETAQISGWKRWKIEICLTTV